MKLPPLRLAGANFWPKKIHPSCQILTNLALCAVYIPSTVASLTSLAILLSPTSFLWTAFHTAQVRDMTRGASMTAAEVFLLRADLNNANFTLPNMRQNMSNSEEVEAFSRDNAGYRATVVATGVEAALPPQLPPSLNPPPLPLLLPCTSSSLPAAVRSAYRGLGVPAGGEDTPVVVLCDEGRSKKMMSALSREVYRCSKASIFAILEQIPMV